MKPCDHPILFSAPMVRAILAGTKTQTRRVVKYPASWLPYADGNKAKAFELFHAEVDTAGSFWNCADLNGEDDFRDHWQCGDEKLSPNWQVGDQIWVKETFRHYGNKFEIDDWFALLTYHADGKSLEKNHPNPPKKKWWNTGKTPWTPSIFMPRWASRITLEIVKVRVERLQDISENDARAEGCLDETPKSLKYSAGFLEPGVRRNYCDLWDRINGDGAWAKNPWVWVIEFKPLAQGGLTL